ncbi:MAG TPA: hypothetical protein VGP47_06860 [Parachlamydiaceae bacterium]|nr:hypothetical protein [Parachlamydiaceae bacterium]
MNFHSFEPRSRSWMYITCVVVAVHTFSIGWAVLLDAPTPMRQQNAPSRLVVQTISFKSNPIPRNPIPRTPISPTPLERKKVEATPIPPVPIKQPELEEIIVNPTPPPPLVVPPPTETLNPPVINPTKPTPAPIKPPVLKKPVVPPKKPEVKKIDTHTNAQKAAAEKAAADVKKKKDDAARKKKQQDEAAKKKHDEDAAKKKQLDDAAKKRLEDEAVRKNESEKLVERERQQKLVALAQESIAKISGSSDKGAPKRVNATLSPVPNAIANLEVDTLSVPKGAPAISYRETTYRDELASRLKLLMRLPEYGDVKINLTLDRSGKVLKVSVISAESKVNRTYVEKTLPGLTFPSFGGNFESAAEYTFPITLSNE